MSYSVNKDKKSTITPTCVGNYVKVLEKAPVMKGSADLAYSMLLVFEKTLEVKRWVKEIGDLYVKIFADKLRGGNKITDAKEMVKKITKRGKHPLKDGDSEDVSGKIKNLVEGCYYMSVKNPEQPFIIGADGKAVDAKKVTKREIYSGASYRCSISFWAYNHSVGGVGISATLNALMKVEDGENLDGLIDKTEVEDMFSEYKDEGLEVGLNEDDLESADDDSPYYEDGEDGEEEDDFDFF